MSDIEFKIEAKHIKKIVDTVKTMVEETIILFDEDGIYVKAMDPANVGMVDITLRKEAFESFDAEDSKIGLNLNNINDYLNIIDEEEVIDVKIEKDSKMTLETDELWQEMSLLDTKTMKVPEIPVINMVNNVKINSNYLKKGQRASVNISDHFTLEVDPEIGYIKIYTSDETNTNSIELTIDKDKCEDFDVERFTKSMYGLDYFSDIMSTIKRDEIIDLRTDEDYPVKMKYKFADGDGVVIFMIAPRIYTE